MKPKNIMKILFTAILIFKVCELRSQCAFSNQLNSYTINSNNQSQQYEYGLEGYYLTFDIQKIGTIYISNFFNYITLTDELNNVLTSGTADFSYDIINPGNYRLHFSVNSSCDANGTLINFDYLFKCPQVDLIGSIVENQDLNNGSFTQTYQLKHSLYKSDKFSGTNGEDFILSNKVSVTNLPSGLTANITRTNDSILSLTLTGNASAHESSNDISNLTFTFNSTAFTIYNATQTVNSTMNNIPIEFIQEYIVGSSGDFSTISSAIAGADDFDILNIAAETFTETNITINKNLRFIGAGAKNTIIQGHNDYDQAGNRIFYLNSNLTVEFSNLTIKNGRAGNTSLNGSAGAAIQTGSDLNLLKIENCIIKDNIANADEGGSTTQGGAISAEGNIILKNCLFDNNIIRSSTGGAQGGAVKISTNSSVLVENCTFVNNVIYDNTGNAIGAGMWLINDGNEVSTIRNCTFTNNSLDNSGNPIGKGGGLYVTPYNSTENDINIENCILYGNSAAAGADLYHQKGTYNTNCVFNVSNSIYQYFDYSTDGGINGTNSGNSTSDPLLITINDNGGQMSSVAIQSGSPAINNGLNTNAPTKDIRGFNRDANTDIGAYEYGACGIPTIVSVTSNSRCGNGSITLEATPSGGATIKWYDAITGGNLISDDSNFDLSGNNLIINNLTATTSYFAEASMFACTSTARTEVIATHIAIPTVSGTTPASRCGAGSITISASPSVGSIKWYDASTGGNLIVDDADYDLSGNNLTINNLTTTTAYYAEADNGGCVSATRTEVFATISSGGFCYSGGSGTVGDPYLIGNKADLKTLSENSGEWAKHFKQISNISFLSSDFQSGGDFFNSGAGINQIGYGLNQFTGTYDGDNYYVDGLIMNRSSQSQVGMFGLVGSGSDLKNIKLTNVSISGNFETGALVGKQLGGTISNCSSTGSVTGQDYYIGGLIGLSNGNISNSFSTVSVNANRSSGGFIGRIDGGSVSECFSSGNVTTTGDYVGGFASSNYGSVTNCYSSSNVTGNEVVGGFIGMQSATLLNCYSNGKVTGLGALDNGGFIGYYNTGTTTNCFWDTQVSTFNTSGGTGGSSETGKTTIEMQTEGTFTSWDFSTIWKMSLGCPSNGSPIFQSQTSISRPSISSPITDARCGTGSLDLGATASAGDVKWYAASSGGSSLGTGAGFTTPSISTTTSYWAEADNGGCVSASRTEIVATINDCSTQLAATSCGKVLTSMDDPLYSDAVAGATNYRYWVQHAATGYSAVSIRGFANNLWNASWLVANPLKYGTTYTVMVSAYVDGAWQPYGSSCNITTPATKLDANSCGKALTSLSEKLYSLPVAGATDYRYEVRKKGDNSLVAVSYRGSNNNLFQLTWLTTNPAQNNTAYAIRVAAYVGGSWQAYGPVCYVVTPTTTKLATSSCNVTVSSLDQVLYSEAIVGATDYRYEVRKSDNSFVAVSTRGFANNLWKLSWLVANPAQLNTTYIIRVAAYIDGIWSAYGTACTVTTPSAMIINENDSFVALNLETYPNPNDGNFTISSSQEGTFNIINELGQLIQKVEITEENNFQTKVNDIQRGVYFVTGTINNEVITKKVVVQ